MIDRCFKKFWWGFDPQKSLNLSLKSWQSICKPKSVSGLGFRPLYLANQALVCKLAWLVHTGSSYLWVSLCRAKYMHTVLGVSPASRPNSLWLWQGIVKASFFISQAACYLVKNGESIRLWLDPWIPNLEGFLPSPRDPYVDLDISLSVSDLMFFNPRRWNGPLIWQLFDDSSAEAILQLHLSLSNVSDRWIWIPEPKGYFSVKSGYRLVSSSPQPEQTALPPSKWKSLWRLRIHACLKLLLWKVVWNILPTQSRLLSIFGDNPADSIRCHLCGEFSDSLTYLIFHCPFSVISWRESPWVLCLEFFHDYSIADWIRIICAPTSIVILQCDCHWF